MPVRRFSVAAGQAIQLAIKNGEPLEAIKERARLYGIHPDTLQNWLRPPVSSELEHCVICGEPVKTHARCELCGQLLGYGEHSEWPGRLCSGCERRERRKC